MTLENRKESGQSSLQAVFKSTSRGEPNNLMKAALLAATSWAKALVSLAFSSASSSAEQAGGPPHQEVWSVFQRQPKENHCSERVSKPEKIN